MCVKTGFERELNLPSADFLSLRVEFFLWQKYEILNT